MNEHTNRLLHRLQEYTGIAADTAEMIDSGAPPGPHTAEHIAAFPAEPSISFPDALRQALAKDSLVLPHAVRAAVATAAGVLLARLLGLSHGYWLTITVVIILQPYAGATMVRALQRVIGTVAGALLTGALAALLHDSRALLVVVFCFAVVCAAFLRYNYLVYSIFLTPTFVLLAEMSAGDWHLAGIRALDTTLGGALALVAAWLLWPSREQTRFPALCGTMLEACARHLRLVASMWDRTDDASANAIAEGRRQVGLAALNAEASLERAIAEIPIGSSRLEPAMTMVTFTRRLLHSATALAASRYAPGTQAARPAVETLVSRVATVLDDLGRALPENRTPASVGHLLEGLSDVEPALLRQPFERIAGQVHVLHDAAERLTTS